MQASLVVRNGKYHVVISYKDEFGNWQKKWYTTGLDEQGNKNKAKEVMFKKIDEFKKIATYSNKDRSNMLFADYLEEWLELSKPNLQISTYATYKQQVEKIADYFRKTNITLLNLKPLDISRFYKAMQDEGKSVQVCEHYHVNIRKALQVACRADLIPNNPADKIDRPKSPKHTASFYNTKELNEFFQVIKNHKYELLYRMTAIYGLRRSEVIGIKWKNIDFENNALKINHAVVQVKINGKLVIVAKDQMKNKSSIRTLPLLPEIKELLIIEKEKQQKNKDMYKGNYSSTYLEYLFVDDLGHRLNPETVSRSFMYVQKRYNLRKLKFHELRHSCASLLLECGVQMKDIQEWLGHSTFKTTADIYAHLDVNSKQQVGKVLSNKFKQDIDSQDYEVVETFELTDNFTIDKMEDSFENAILNRERDEFKKQALADLNNKATKIDSKDKEMEEYMEFLEWKKKKETIRRRNVKINC